MCQCVKYQYIVTSYIFYYFMNNYLLSKIHSKNAGFSFGKQNFSLTNLMYYKKSQEFENMMALKYFFKLKLQLIN